MWPSPPCSLFFHRPHSIVGEVIPTAESLIGIGSPRLGPNVRRALKQGDAQVIDQYSCTPSGRPGKVWLVPVDRAVETQLLDIGEDEPDPTRVGGAIGAIVSRSTPPAGTKAGRKLLIGLIAQMQTEPDLLKVIGACAPPGRFAGCLHRRQQQCD